VWKLDAWFLHFILVYYPRIHFATYLAWGKPTLGRSKKHFTVFASYSPKEWKVRRWFLPFHMSVDFNKWYMPFAIHVGGFIGVET